MTRPPMTFCIVPAFASPKTHGLFTLQASVRLFLQQQGWQEVAEGKHAYLLVLFPRAKEKIGMDDVRCLRGCGEAFEANILIVDAHFSCSGLPHKRFPWLHLVQGAGFDIGALEKQLESWKTIEPEEIAERSVRSVIRPEALKKAILEHIDHFTEANPDTAFADLVASAFLQNHIGKSTTPRLLSSSCPVQFLYGLLRLNNKSSNIDHRLNQISVSSSFGADSDELDCVRRFIDACRDILRDLHNSLPNGSLERNERNNLNALLILCQGYLAVHACYSGERSDWHVQDLSCALQAMNATAGDKVPQRFDLTEWSARIPVTIADVRQPEWWLTVFGLWADDKRLTDELTWEMFTATIIQEWSEVSNSHPLPFYFRRLLELLRKGDEIASPRVVADAYAAAINEDCINSDTYEKYHHEIKETEWLTLRKDFRHDWFYGYLAGLETLVSNINKPTSTNIEWCENHLVKWENKFECAEYLLHSFMTSMSRQCLFMLSPLKRCDSVTTSWLGAFAQELWEFQYKDETRMPYQNGVKALEHANESYHSIKSGLQPAITAARITALKQDFQNFLSACEDLKVALNTFLSSIRVS